MHYLYITLAIVVFLGIPVAIAIARDKFHGLRETHRIGEILHDDAKRQREEYERFLHPSGGGHAYLDEDLDKEWR